ncbi:surfactin synthase thioesterase subunit [Nitrospirillum amazonense]|uniref:Surfactin synthase thioesterase subunit n=1 Tax=Nitrospirillum amazonense TaxID=28077 RepID=A0A560ESQ2_9PROT|nr:surfactin synthase thioesterase subunit [Nitrospirillum amazonense]
MQLPGRENRSVEPFEADIMRAADRIAAEIRPWASVPYFLFGHSLGASLAFEVARRLERDRAALPPAGLVVSGQQPFHLRPPPESRVHRSTLDDAAFVAMLRRYNGTPSEILDNVELREIFLPILRADFRLSESHPNDAEPVRAPLLVLGGRDDLLVPAEDLGGWRRYGLDDPEVHVLPGDHFFTRSAEPEVCALVARFIAARLASSALSVTAGYGDGRGLLP